jgi:hypothetical protein
MIKKMIIFAGFASVSFIDLFGCHDKSTCQKHYFNDVIDNIEYIINTQYPNSGNADGERDLLRVTHGNYKVLADKIDGDCEVYLRVWTKYEGNNFAIPSYYRLAACCKLARAMPKTKQIVDFQKRAAKKCPWADEEGIEWSSNPSLDVLKYEDLNKKRIS